ncbi:Glu-tRNA(Gln) amidotransferase GatDE subunit E [Desulfurococcaceae archaeon AG1]|jgi:glutamyl-tRNA(Gln) amidotransferase subunit E|nr:Glu-tRNA(Gln) amidotransferase GatDE subunit E [Desulfurococcaceae archaeon AG1]
MYRLDYKELGLIVGLEIHQQLDTETKLFCNCPARIVDNPEGSPVIIRRLRASRSELGEIDPAALFEYQRGRLFKYLAPPEVTCLVELDEEPPHPINREAVIIALAIAKALHASHVDEIHVMRKIVVDGSNTSGFQRTAVIALGGYIDDEEGVVRIQSVTLEEDSARKLGEEDGTVIYCLDRLGIPLIEISTGPDIHSPEQAERVAYKIGMILRLTGKVKRGLGTIRQDLNISIKGGSKIEIKGVQRLELISKVVEYEAYRQYRLLQLRNEILRRGLDKNGISEETLVDVSSMLRESGSKLLRSVIERGGVAMLLPLRGFKGLLGWDLGPGRRFGTELADYARQWGGVRGLIHSDELPGYGIDEALLKKIYGSLGLDMEKDAFIIIADQKEKVLKAFKMVIERIKMAFEGVPRETRAVNEDGTTHYMRPQPGSARMYPETDIPPLRITNELLREADKYVPEPLEVKMKRFIEDHGLSRELAEQVIRSRYLPLYEELVSKYRGNVQPSLIASTLINTLKSLRAEGVDTDSLSEETLGEIFELLSKGMFSKEAIPDIIRYVCEKRVRPSKAIEDLGIRKLSSEEVEKIVEDFIEKNRLEVVKRGDKAYGYVMGRVMEILRGRADGKIVSEIVRRKLSSIKAE